MENINYTESIYGDISGEGDRFKNYKWGGGIDI